MFAKTKETKRRSPERWSFSPGIRGKRRRIEKQTERERHDKKEHTFIKHKQT